MNLHSSNSIWAKWIFTFSFIVIITGFCFLFIVPFLVPQVTEPFFTEITGMASSDLTEEQFRYINFVMGVGGAVMIGWGIMLTFLGYRLIKRPENWIWTSIAAGLIVWYVSDTLISILTGSSLNVILNCVFFLIALPPLIISREKIINGLRTITPSD